MDLPTLHGEFLLAVTGGIQVGPDGRVHTTFGHNPSTLRLCSFDPNMQNIPRGGGEWERLVKAMFVAPPGYMFWERDYSGIEAVLVGYFAGARGYTRLAKLDVHSFYTAYGLHTLDGRVSANDLPSLDWDNERLRKRLAEIKKEFGKDRNSLYKHLVHGANFLQSPKGAQEKIFKETNIVYDVKLIKKVMDVYFELFPEIRVWHRAVCESVDGTRRDEEKSDHGVCYARNPFGYIHHFYNVLNWEKIDGKWYSSFGEDAKRLVAFLPQSTASAIIKQSARKIYYEYPWVGNTLRLLIHDATFGECRDSDIDSCLRVSQEVMESPIPQLPLDPSWGMGEFLTILTEAKVGPTWADMH